MPGPWKAWKTKQRFPTFPLGARDDDDGSLSKPKTKERKSAATRPPHSPSRLFLRSSKTDFMLIFQLENATPHRPAVAARRSADRYSP
jgi:hypothetical protein